jgi:hypothetical protein
MLITGPCGRACRARVSRQLRNGSLASVGAHSKRVRCQLSDLLDPDKLVSWVPGADPGYQSPRAQDRILTTAPDLFCELGELFFEPRGLRGQRLRWLPPIGGVQLSQITGDAFCSSYARRRSTFAPREVPIAIVPRLGLAAVDRNARTHQQTQSTGRVRQNARTLRMARPLSFWKSATSCGHGRASLKEPHQLDIAAGFALEPPARLHPVEIAVE